MLLNTGKRKEELFLSYQDDVLRLGVEKKKKGMKKQIIEEVLIPKSEIKETKLKINFK